MANPTNEATQYTGGMELSSKLICCVFGLLFAAMTALAQQETGEINGRVVNSRDNEPLAVVQVELAGTSYRAVTGEDGTFRIPGVPAGNYALQVAAVGFFTARQEFTL